MITNNSGSYTELFTGSGSYTELFTGSLTWRRRRCRGGVSYISPVRPPSPPDCSANYRASDWNIRPPDVAFVLIETRLGPNFLNTQHAMNLVRLKTDRHRTPTGFDNTNVVDFLDRPVDVEPVHDVA